MGGVNHFSGNVRGVSPSKMLKEVGKTLPRNLLMAGSGW